MDSSQSQPKYDSKLVYDDDLRPTTLARSFHSESFHGLSTDETPVYRSISSHDSSNISDPTLYKSVSSTSNKISYPSHSVYSNPKSGLEIRKSAYVEKTIVEPPTVPAYLEPSYHIVCRAKPFFLLESIVTFAKSNDLEFRVLPQKYKVKCIAYPLGESKVPFVVSIFQMDSDEQGKRYAVEFQRRSGDVLHFSGLWATCKRHFGEKGFIEKDNLKIKNLETPKLDDVTVTDKQIRETLRCLLQMASSNCCDVKCQAIAALSKMSNEGEVQELMLEEACLDVFLTAASSKVEDIHRCAVFALANLAQSAAICQSIAEKGGVSILCSLSRSSTNQVVRDCSRVLCSIASRLGSGVMNDEFRETLQTFSHSSDSSTQQVALKLEALRL